MKFKPSFDISLNFHENCMLEICLISLLKRLDISLNSHNSIRAPVVHSAFATFQIELYRVVDYDSK